MKNTFMNRLSSKGFTLVELMVIVVIIGILTAVAVPAYKAYVTTGNRADAKTALLGEAGRMEEFYLNNDTYDGATVSSATSPKGLYKMELSGETAFAYLLTATRNLSTDDPECLSLTLDQLGTQGSSGSASAVDCWTK